MRKSPKPDQDRWGPAGPKITSADKLDAIRKVLASVGPIIVEHKHYRGARGPDLLSFQDFDEFRNWLDSTAEGDAIWVWDFAAVCNSGNSLAHGKCPDERGWVPAGGAY